MKTYRTNSDKETKIVAAIIAEKIFKSGLGRKAKVICLEGDLGAGKTTFAQGLIRSLGGRGRVSSPTFVLMKSFNISPIQKNKTNWPGWKKIYHLDVYRFKNYTEASVLDLEKIFSNPEAIIIIEWPERIAKILPKNKIILRFERGEKETERVIMAA